MRDRALHELDTAISSGQLQRLQRAMVELEACGLGNRLRVLGSSFLDRAEKCRVSDVQVLDILPLKLLGSGQREHEAACNMPTDLQGAKADEHVLDRRVR